MEVNYFNKEVKILSFDSCEVLIGQRLTISIRYYDSVFYTITYFLKD